MSAGSRRDLRSGLAAARIFARSISDVRSPSHSSLDQDTLHELYVRQLVGSHHDSSPHKGPDIGKGRNIESKFNLEFKDKVRIVEHEPDKERNSPRLTKPRRGNENTDLYNKSRQGVSVRRTLELENIQTPFLGSRNVDNPHTYPCRTGSSRNECVTETKVDYQCRDSIERTPKNACADSKGKTTVLRKESISGHKDPTILHKTKETNTSETGGVKKKKKKKKKKSTSRDRTDTSRDRTDKFTIQAEREEEEMKRRGNNADREDRQKRSRAPWGGGGREGRGMAWPAGKSEAAGYRSDKTGFLASRTRRPPHGCARQSRPGGSEGFVYKGLYSDFKKSIGPSEQGITKHAEPKKFNETSAHHAKGKLKAEEVRGQQVSHSNDLPVQACETMIEKVEETVSCEVPMEVQEYKYEQDDKCNIHDISETADEPRQQKSPRPRIAWNELIKNISVTEERLKRSQINEEGLDSVSGGVELDFTISDKQVIPDKPWWFKDESQSVSSTAEDKIGKPDSMLENASSKEMKLGSSNPTSAPNPVPISEVVRTRKPLRRHPPSTLSGSQGNVAVVEDIKQNEIFKERLNCDRKFTDNSGPPQNNYDKLTSKSFVELVPDHSSKLVDHDSDCEIIGTTYEPEHVLDVNQKKKVTSVVGQLLQHLVNTVAECEGKNICTKAKYGSCGCTSCIGIAMAEEFAEEVTVKNTVTNSPWGKLAVTVNTKDAVSRDMCLLNKFRHGSTCDAAMSDVPRGSFSESPIVITDACPAASSPGHVVNPDMKIKDEKVKDIKTSSCKSYGEQQESMDWGETDQTQMSEHKLIKEKSKDIVFVTVQRPTQSSNGDFATVADKKKMCDMKIQINGQHSSINAESVKFDTRSANIDRDAEECVHDICSKVSERGSIEYHTKTGRREGLWNYDRFYRGLSADFESRRSELAGDVDQRRTQSAPPPSLEGEPLEETCQPSSPRRVSTGHWTSEHGGDFAQGANWQDAANNNKLPYPNQQNDVNANLHQKERKYIPPYKRMEYVKKAGNLMDSKTKNEEKFCKSSIQQRWREIHANLPQELKLEQTELRRGSNTPRWYYDEKSALDETPTNPFGPVGSKCPTKNPPMSEATSAQDQHPNDTVISENYLEEPVSNTEPSGEPANPPGFFTGREMNTFIKNEMELSESQTSAPGHLQATSADKHTNSGQGDCVVEMKAQQPLAPEEQGLYASTMQQPYPSPQNVSGPRGDTSEKPDFLHPPGFLTYPFQIESNLFGCQQYDGNQPFQGPQNLADHQSPSLQTSANDVPESDSCANATNAAPGPGSSLMKQEPDPSDQNTSTSQAVALEQNPMYFAQNFPPSQGQKQNLGYVIANRRHKDSWDQYWGGGNQASHGNQNQFEGYENRYDNNSRSQASDMMQSPQGNRKFPLGRQDLYPRGMSPRYPHPNVRHAGRGTPPSARGSPRFGPRVHRAMQNYNRRPYFDGRMPGGPRQGQRPDRSWARQPIPRLLDMDLRPNGPRRFVPRNVQLIHRAIAQSQMPSDSTGIVQPFDNQFANMLGENRNMTGENWYQPEESNGQQNRASQFVRSSLVDQSDDQSWPLSFEKEEMQQQSQMENSNSAKGVNEKQTEETSSNVLGLGLSLVQEYDSPEAGEINDPEDFDIGDNRPASQEDIPFYSQESTRDLLPFQSQEFTRELPNVATGSFTSLNGNSLTGSSSCSGIRMPVPTGNTFLRPLRPPGVIEYPGYNMRPPGPPPNLDWKIMSLSDYGSSSGGSTPTVCQSPRRQGPQATVNKDRSGNDQLEEGEIQADEKEEDEGPDDWFDADEDTIVQLIKERQAKLAAKGAGRTSRPQGKNVAMSRTQANTPTQNSAVRRVQGGWANDIPTFPRDHPKRRWSDLPQRTVVAPQAENILAYKAFGPSVPTASPDPLASVTWGDWKTRFKKKYEKVLELYIDTHCHLDFLFNNECFKGTFHEYRTSHSETFPRCYAGCVAVFCHPRTFTTFGKGGLWEELLKESDIWGAVGCHPKHAQEFSDEAMAALYEMLTHPKVKAVGEIGLDYSGTFAQHASMQKIVFKLHLDIALKLNMPIVIHCRDAEEDCIQVLEEKIPRNHRIHRHCFTGTWEQCQTWLHKFPNSYIGLTPLVTFRGPRSEGPRDVARMLPLEKLLLETDTPFFVPRQIPRGSMPNSHPGLAITVAEEVAFLRGISMEQVLQVSLVNARRMYDI